MAHDEHGENDESNENDGEGGAGESANRHVEDFQRCLSVSGAGFDLGRAFATVGLIADPALDVDAVVDRLHNLASEVAEECFTAMSDSERLHALNEALFERRGFRGDERDYDDPRNRYLHEALERRLGIPITLSIIYIEVGKSLALRLDGVGFPGHFLVRATTVMGAVYLDPFHGGRFLKREDLAGMLERSGGNPQGQLEVALAAVTPRQILDRVLNNLKVVYLKRQEPELALRTVDLRVALAPWRLEETRDRGLLAAALGRYRQAVDDLSTYLEGEPEAADAPRLRAQLRELRERLA